ncbi:deoxyguanosinetriphosphate triphosphohydrolase [Roseivirga sp. E12]|uniref:deoxyguanosinetriphosphate triphosphohydrolase n=1 Tax=Roseivirga sp. E12 TaxID=2819237 RepID=UPI001ABD2624|nr:deoxyguanosinetriphosphate triphosphohydrolase [Roseivirga sp. E12]MBO3698875.1 deoxyguanosinetriphosphate triphosphohydrolase [Roseivirga sp. E12]
MDWKVLLNSGESHQKNTDRSVFDRDFDRIIFSHPFRKLQDKTQVHPLPEHDFVHNRLTHSLEVSSVGRSLGRSVGAVILQRHPELEPYFNANDFGLITASASLAHDIGNPPFGHSGEDAISDYFVTNKDILESDFTEQQWFDLINFEGNAQGFRLLNKSGYQGLRLTKPTLAAFTKYPRPSKVADQFKPRRSQKKYGFYHSEAEIFDSLAKDLQLHQLADAQWCRHPLAFLVEAADDICYHIIDLEDGCNLGLISHQDTVDLYEQVIGSKFDAAKLSTIKSKAEQISLLRAMSIGELIKQSVEHFLANEEGILSGDYDISLTDDIRATSALEEIKNVSVQKIYRAQHVVEIEAAGFNVLNGLLESFVPAVLTKTKMSKKQSVAFRLLPEDLKAEIEASDDQYTALRALLDYISGLTDSNAMSLYRKLMGISLPSMR